MKIQISLAVSILTLIVSYIAYAEWSYQKKDDSTDQFRQAEINRYQTEIDLINLKSEIPGQVLTPMDKYQLKYFKDKRDNLQKEGSK